MRSTAYVSYLPRGMSEIAVKQHVKNSARLIDAKNLRILRNLPVGFVKSYQNIPLKELFLFYFNTSWKTFSDTRYWEFLPVKVEIKSN